MEAVSQCRHCSLWKGRTNAVAGEGDIESSAVLVGEAPGRKEDESGKPFVGSAGKLLDEALFSVGLSRSEIYITNLVKCRPPGNRKPKSRELDECTQYLNKQLRIISPRVVAPLGNSALKYFFKKFNLSSTTIGEVHGREFLLKFEWGEVVLFPLYHPASMLYNRKLEKVFLSDLDKMKLFFSTVVNPEGL